MSKCLGESGWRGVQPESEREQMRNNDVENLTYKTISNPSVLERSCDAAAGTTRCLKKCHRKMCRRKQCWAEKLLHQSVRRAKQRCTASTIDDDGAHEHQESFDAIS